MDSYPISSISLEKHYHINGALFSEQYKEYLSDYRQWNQLPHTYQWILFPKNIGRQLSIDETALSNGELYTILTNKAKKGRKGCLVAMIQGTCSDNITQVLKQIPLPLRRQVKEITLDMAGRMNKAVRAYFPHAEQVIDRFHVQKKGSKTKKAC